MQSIHRICLSDADLALIDSELICSISQDQFINPVLTAVGVTYDKDSIAQWLGTNHTDPITRLPITDQLIPNRFVESVLLAKDQKWLNSSHFYCPLTKQLIQDPVTTGEGYTYERAALEAYFLEKGDIEPTTGEPIQWIGQSKFVENKCAKNLITLYVSLEAALRQKIDLLAGYLNQNNLDAILNSDPLILTLFLETQTRENQLKCLYFCIDHLNDQWVAFFIAHFVQGKQDEDEVFFDAVRRIETISAKHFPKSFDPLDSVFSWANLPHQMQTIKNHLTVQQAFRAALIENPSVIAQYTPEQILFSIDSIDENGDTLLHIAVKNNDLPLIQCLLNHGINFTKKNNQNRTAIDIALDNSAPHPTALNLFIEWGIADCCLTEDQKENLKQKKAILFLPPALKFLETWDFLKPVLKLFFKKEVALPLPELSLDLKKVECNKSIALRQAILNRCTVLEFFSSTTKHMDQPADQKAQEANSVSPNR